MRRIDLSEECSPGLTWRDELRREQKRTGLGPHALLRGRSDMPHGLNAPMVDAWIAGRTASAREVHLLYVRALWQSQPRNPLIPITPSMRRELAARLKATGFSADWLLKRNSDAPPGLSGVAIRHWMRPHSKCARKRDWDYVMRLVTRGTKRNMRATAKGAKPRQTGQDYVEISHRFIKVLRAERERTGLSPSALLRNAPDKSVLLSAEMVSNWISGQTKTAIPEHMAFVIAAYRQARTKRP